MKKPKPLIKLVEKGQIKITYKNANQDPSYGYYWDGSWLDDNWRHWVVAEFKDGTVYTYCADE